jgi:hypothetical protein
MVATPPLPLETHTSRPARDYGGYGQSITVTSERYRCYHRWGHGVAPARPARRALCPHAWSWPVRAGSRVATTCRPRACRERHWGCVALIAGKPAAQIWSAHSGSTRPNQISTWKDELMERVGDFFGGAPLRDRSRHRRTGAQRDSRFDADRQRLHRGRPRGCRRRCDRRGQEPLASARLSERHLPPSRTTDREAVSRARSGHLLRI